MNNQPINEAIEILTEANSRFKHPEFDALVTHLKQLIPLAPQNIAKHTQNGRPVRAYIYSLLANKIGDIIESGHIHVYRGILSMRGQSLLEIFDACADELVAINDVTPPEADRIKGSMRESIKRAG